MTIYHLHLLNPQGRRVTSVELKYDSDEEAVAEVVVALQGAAGELWRGRVLVWTFSRVVRDDER